MKMPIAVIAVANSTAALGSAPAADKDVSEVLYSQVLSGTAVPDPTTCVEPVLAPIGRA